jgi:hypothetical protein
MFIYSGTTPHRLWGFHSTSKGYSTHLAYIVAHIIIQVQMIALQSGYAFHHLTNRMAFSDTRQIRNLRDHHRLLTAATQPP